MAEKLGAITNGERWDYIHSDQPICPHCGAEYRIMDHDAWYLLDDSQRHEVECPSCDLSFSVESHSRWTFSTDDQEDEE